jgi:hypothetical protein
VRSKIGLQDHLNIRLIIIDSHRPIWPGHVHSSMEDSLVFLDEDDPVPASVIPDYIKSDDRLLEAGELIASKLMYNITIVLDCAMHEDFQSLCSNRCHFAEVSHRINVNV